MHEAVRPLAGTVRQQPGRQLEAQGHRDHRVYCHFRHRGDPRTRYATIYLPRACLCVCVCVCVCVWALALALALAVAVLTCVTSGVSEINPAVNIGKFFSDHIQPELTHASIDALPVVKASCIKFVSTFRNQLPKAGLVALLPQVANFLRAKPYVVHTYAASTIERMLTVRERLGATKGIPLAVQPADLKPLIEVMLRLVFELILKPDYPENEYIVRCLCRIVYSAKEQVLPVAAGVLNNMKQVVERIAKDPKNPTFNHYVFECLASLVRTVCGANPAAVAQFETALFPAFTVRVDPLGACRHDACAHVVFVWRPGFAENPRRGRDGVPALRVPNHGAAA